MDVTSLTNLETLIKEKGLDLTPEIFAYLIVGSLRVLRHWEGEANIARNRRDAEYHMTQFIRNAERVFGHPGIRAAGEYLLHTVVINPSIANDN